MDLLTHGLLGAVAAAAIARRGGMRVAAVVGGLAGCLPDADVFIQSGADPLLVLDYHRHFTHSLLFMPLGALLVAVLVWPLVRRHIGFWPIWWYALPAYALAPLLDACTSYGTHLWWPFSERQEAWGFIAVFDPLFTLLVAISLWFGWRRRQRIWPCIGLSLAAAYLSVGAWQHARVAERTAELAQERGHRPEQVQVKPTLANLLLWRSVYRVGDQVHADAHRAGLAGVRSFSGQQAVLLSEADARDWAAGDHLLRRDLERFRKFSDGYLLRDARDPDYIGDARYAMLPDRLAPIWGIEKQTAGSVPRIRFIARRDTGPEVRERFFAMLLDRGG